jgi:hypothetical protein
MVLRFTLNCWVRSENERGMFPVEISKTETVHDLKEAIKNKKAVAFRDVDAINFTLYKPKDPVSIPYEEKLILSEHSERLEGADELSEVFPVQPPKRDIHLIVGM